MTRDPASAKKSGASPQAHHAWAAVAAIHATDLDGIAKAVLIAIARHSAQRRGRCDASVATLARETGFHDRKTVVRALHRLMSQNLLRVVRITGVPSRRTVNWAAVRANAVAASHEKSDTTWPSRGARSGEPDPSEGLTRQEGYLPGPSEGPQGVKKCRGEEVSSNSTFSQDSSIVDVADNGTAAAVCSSDVEREAFDLLGFDRPAGNRKFREAWVRCFAEWKASGKPYITETMEQFIQQCEGRIGVPRFFYDAKKETEQRETVAWERVNRRSPL